MHMQEKNDSLERSISNRRGDWIFVSFFFFFFFYGGVGAISGLLCFMEISVFNANIVDTMQNMASDLGLHCLPMSLLWITRHK